MKYLVFSSLAASVAIAAAPASASPVVPQAKAQLAQQTTPRTGTAQPNQAPTEITRQQMIDNVKRRFEAIDSNRDGFITEAESDAAAKRVHDALEKRLSDRGDAAFARLDQNKDGSISRAEFEASVGAGAKTPPTAAQKAAAWGRAARIDNDKNGMISRAEFNAAQGQIADRRGAAVDRMFEGADANNDGKVSLAEATAAATASFDRADTNRDGKLSREEMVNARRAAQSTGSAR